MSAIEEPEPVKLICPTLAADVKLFKKVETILQNKYGPIDLTSETWDFDFTDYYEKEMGKGLQRRIYSFRKRIDPAELADVKVFTNYQELQITKAYKDMPGRAVNLDPGYVCNSKLVLASTKDFSHRIYLRAGIYAEITLQWKGEHFTPLQTTYPDYRSEKYRAFFALVRAINFTQSKNKEK